MKEIQDKVEKITLNYIELYPDEYKQVCIQLEGEREKLNNKYASLGKDRVVDRKIHEIPETLHNMIINKLTAAELSQIKAGEEGKKFAYWFAKRFPEFRSSDLI